MLKKIIKNTFILSVAVVSIFAVGYINANGATATQNVLGWAWSSNIGWISFSSDTDGSSVKYGVNIDNAGNLSGYAWSPNIGWISFNRSDTGNPPEAPFNTSSGPIAKYNSSSRDIIGWARVLSHGSSWDGWIKFYDTTVNAGGHLSDWAWSNNVVGWINFSVGGTDGVHIKLPVASITAVSDNINYGDSTTISWSSTNASSCSVSGPGLSASGISGSRTIVPQYYDTSKTYTVNCSNIVGTASSSVVVSVNTACSISLKYLKLLEGQHNTVYWSCGNPVPSAYSAGNACRISGGIGNVSVSPATVNNSKKIKVTAGTTGYTLSCKNSDGAYKIKGSTGTSVIGVPNIHEVIPGL